MIDRKIPILFGEPVSWTLLCEDEQPSYIQELHNKYEGRIFIIGNGPSLLTQDLTSLSIEHTFVCNNFFKWKEAPFIPDFYAVNYQELKKGRIDPIPKDHDIQTGMRFILNSGEEPEDTEPGWMMVYKANFFEELINDREGKPEFQGLNSPMLRVPSSATSPLVMACLAIWLGFREIYFLGCEQTSNYVFNKNDGQRWPILDMYGGFRWQRFYEYFTEKGLVISDCTPNGLLNKPLTYTPLNMALGKVKNRKAFEWEASHV